MNSIIDNDGEYEAEDQPNKSDDDDEDDATDSSGKRVKIPFLSSISDQVETRRNLLEAQINLSFFGLYPIDVIQSLRDTFEENQTFSPGIRESLTKTPPDDSLRQILLDPPCFEEFKIPSTKGAASSRQAAFEKPLFDQACQLRSILLPLTAAKIMLEEGEERTGLQVINLLLEKITKDFQELNYKRIVAVTPDPATRKFMKLKSDNAFLNPDVQLVAAESKKLAKTFAPPKKPPRSTHRPTEQHQRTTPTRSSTPSVSTPSTRPTPRTPPIRGSPPQRRGRQRGSAPQRGSRGQDGDTY